MEFFTKGEFHAHQIKKTLAESKTAFQTATLVETVSFGKVLIIDRETQSTEYDEFIYHEALVLPALLAHKRPETALILGGGEGATAREILNSKTVKKLVMADIDHNVLKFAKKHLYSWHRNSFENEKFSLLVQDAGKYVENTALKFDLVYSDLPSPVEGGPAYRLYTLEFYRRLKGVMAEGAIFTTQAGPGTPVEFELHPALRNTLSKVFRHVFSYSFFVPGYDMPWAFLLASDRDLSGELKKEKTDVRIAKRLKNKPRLMNGEAVEKLSNLPLYLTKMIKRDKRIITKDKPVFFSTSR